MNVRLPQPRHIVAQGGGAAWKTGCFRSAPWWVHSVMAANFRSLPGAWAVAGLMGAPLWLWCRRQVAATMQRGSTMVQQTITLVVSNLQGHLHSLSCRYLRGSLLASPALGAMVVSGRLVAAAVEVWVLRQYLGSMLRADAEALQADRS